jgi:hypothetical protein
MDISNSPDLPEADYEIGLVAGDRLDVLVLISAEDPVTGQPILDQETLSEVVNALPLPEHLPGVFGPGERSQMMRTSQGDVRARWRTTPYEALTDLLDT